MYWSLHSTTGRIIIAQQILDQTLRYMTTTTVFTMLLDTNPPTVASSLTTRVPPSPCALFVSTSVLPTTTTGDCNRTLLVPRHTGTVGHWSASQSNGCPAQVRPTAHLCPYNKVTGEQYGDICRSGVLSKYTFNIYDIL